MIYVDELRYYDIKGPMKGWWCHMWCDGNLQELHTMALDIGLELKWFQFQNGRFLHYDLRQSKRDKALKLGAVFRPLSEEIYRRTV